MWQGRFTSFLMDGQYVLAASRYIELNPVRAKLTKNPEDYPWSSAAAHIKGCADGLVVLKPLLRLVDDWREFLAGGVSEEEYSALRKHERAGRPLRSKRFVKQLEKKQGRVFAKRRETKEAEKLVWCPLI